MQIFFSKFLWKWEVKSTRIWNVSLKLEFSVFNFSFLFLFFFLFFSKIFFSSFESFPNSHIYNVVSTLINVVKLQVENNNGSSKLFNVVNFNVDIHNVVSTLIWRCPTLCRHINLTTTLKQRWKPLHKKWSFPLKISSVNVTKYAVTCGFGHIYWRNP